MAYNYIIWEINTEIFLIPAYYLANCYLVFHYYQFATTFKANSYSSTKCTQ